jgi:glycosyltransferase involved in cell wall biosynthesis
MVVNLHIYPSPFMFESRIMKETNSLIKLKLVNQIIIASGWQKGLKENEVIGSEFRIKRFRLFSQFIGRYGKILKYFEFYIRVFFEYRNQHIHYLNCHSLLVLPIGFLLKKFGKTKILIYDPHELETEKVGLTGMSQTVSKWMERKLLNYVDKIIVVCDPIAEWYKNEYKLKMVYVIRNMPYRHSLSKQKSNILKENFNIPPSHILYIYQGILNKDRGVDILLEVFKKAPSDKHILFMGYGESVSLIKQISTNHKNVHYQKAVKHSEIISYTSSADIGIFFLPGQICLSYKYCLPNKFGEYLFAGLPVLVSSSLSYLSELIKNENIGWSIDANNINKLSEFVKETGTDTLYAKQINVNKFSQKSGWEFEEILYSEIYN